MKKIFSVRLIKFLVITANVLTVYGILYHRLTERFASTLMQLAGYAMLIGILLINTYLLLKKSQPDQT